MKLIFEKNAKNEIAVKLAVGTVPEDFSYTKMIKQLIKKNKFESTSYAGLTAEEKGKIEEMLKKIQEAVEEEDVR